jgi:hypothetical protein
LKPRVILWTFVAFDVVTTVVQIAGAAMIGNAESKLKSPEVANDIVLAGLAVQTFAFTCFLVLFGVLTVAMIRDRELGPRLGRIGPFIVALEVASILVYLRTIFRLVETSEGVFGYLMTHEAFFGGLEFTPIIIAVSILAILHPGRLVSGSKERDIASGDDAEKRMRRRHRRNRDGK